MSYTILYRVAFLKLNDNTFIPVGETGDNNVWECDNRRRARDWGNGWSMFYKKLNYSEKEILSLINNEINDIVKQYDGVKENWEDHAYTKDEILKRFSWFSSITIQGKKNSTANEFLGWFKKGIHNAHTVNEYKEMGVTVKLGWYEKMEDDKTEWKSKVINSEEELLVEHDKITAKGCHPYVFYGFIGDCTYKEKICPKLNRTRKEPEKAYIIEVLDHGFLKGKTSRQFLISYRKENAHKYASERAASRMMEALKRNGYSCTIKEISLKSA